VNTTLRIAIWFLIALSIFTQFRVAMLEKKVTWLTEELIQTKKDAAESDEQLAKFMTTVNATTEQTTKALNHHSEAIDFHTKAILKLAGAR
jgi:hypothetical protein